MPLLLKKILCVLFLITSFVYTFLMIIIFLFSGERSLIVGIFLALFLALGVFCFFRSVKFTNKYFAPLTSVPEPNTNDDSSDSLTCSVINCLPDVKDTIASTSDFSQVTPDIDPTLSAQQDIPPEVTKSDFTCFEERVAGISFYTSNLLEIIYENDEYTYSKKEIKENFLENELIYQYFFYSTNVDLVPEPTNPYDPNAIMVFVAGAHIGHIKRTHCTKIKKLLDENRIQKITAELRGGKYKELVVDEFEDICEFKRGKLEFGMLLTIFVKSDID